jgi:hypothetical protein
MNDCKLENKLMKRSLLFPDINVYLNNAHNLLLKSKTNARKSQTIIREINEKKTAQKHKQEELKHKNIWWDEKCAIQKTIQVYTIQYIHNFTTFVAQLSSGDEIAKESHYLLNEIQDCSDQQSKMIKEKVSVLKSISQNIKDCSRVQSFVNKLNQAKIDSQNEIEHVIR